MKKQMRNLKKVVVGFVILIVIILIPINVKQSVNAEDVFDESNKIVDNISIELSKYNEGVSFTNEKDIEKIAEEYDIPNVEDIEEIYYSPIEQNNIELGEITREIGKNEYYVKKKKSSEKKGRLLRSSWFEAPGGTMSVSEKVEIGVSFSNTASVSGGIEEVKAELTASYGFNVSKSISCTDTQNVTVQKGCKRNCKAYVNIKTYNYEIWEDDQWYNDYVGKGTIKKPVGVIFALGKNIKK